MATLEDIEKSSKSFFIGADEVGWGSWAGPLVIVAVRAPRDWTLEGLNDSKKLTPKKREALRPKLMEQINKGIISWHLAELDNVRFDKMGAAKALKHCYVECFHKLYQPDSLIIIDGTLKFDNLGVDAYDKASLIKADAKIATVSAASILAKTYRDELMRNMHPTYPHWGFDHNAGYHSEDHKEGLTKHGVSPLHRMTYAPMKNMPVANIKQLPLDFNEKS